MHLFQGSNLVCVRGERVVFTDLAFALDAGGALVLAGANGSGKSSLLRLMAGLLRPAAGVIAWQGAPIARDADAHRARLQYIGHLDAVKPALTVSENLSFWAALACGSFEAEAGRQALAHFGLDRLADIPARFLSAGQRRRLSLVRLLAVPAPLWLLDEPATALDAPSVAALERAIARHRAAGGLVVAATHAALAIEGAAVLDLSRAAQVRREPVLGAAL